jgi:hypothetical protein
MAKPWAAVAADPRFQALPSDQQEQVPPEQVQQFKTQFDQQPGRRA